METKDYNMIMQEMLKYSSQYGLDTLNFETYSQLYHKLVAMLDHARSYNLGAPGFTYTNSKNEFISVRMDGFIDQLKDFVAAAAKDNDYKLNVDHGKMLNQFARVSEFKYTPKENAVSDQSIEYAMEYFRKLAGLKL